MRFCIAFSKFVCLPSDTSTNVFLGMEISSGWHEVCITYPPNKELTALTSSINTRLHSLFRAPKYYQQALFHASFAVLQDTSKSRDELVTLGHTLAAQWNDLFAARLRKVGPLRTPTLVAQMGSQKKSMELPSTS